MSSMRDYDFLKKEETSTEGYRFDLFEDNGKTAEEVVNDVNRNSIGGSASRARKKSGKVSDGSFIKRTVAIGAVGLILGGAISVNAFDAGIERMAEKAAVNIACSVFREEAIGPNIHRTDGNEYYFYEYDEIADYLMSEGKDFSSELFKSYNTIGEYQTNKVLEHTSYGSVEDYAEDNGFDDVEDWAEAERKKIVLAREIEEKQAELSAMHTDVVASEGANVSEYGGTK